MSEDVFSFVAFRQYTASEIKHKQITSNRPTVDDDFSSSLNFFSIAPNRIKREILEKWPIIRKRSWALTVDTWHIELKGEPTVKQSEGGGTGGFRGLWVHRVDGYTMLMSPLRVAPGSRQLSVTARVIWLCAWVLPRLWVGVQVPIAVTVCYLRFVKQSPRMLFFCF